MPVPSSPLQPSVSFVPGKCALHVKENGVPGAKCTDRFNAHVAVFRVIDRQNDCIIAAGIQRLNQFNTVLVACGFGGNKRVMDVHDRVVGPQFPDNVDDL